MQPGKLSKCGFRVAMRMGLTTRNFIYKETFQPIKILDNSSMSVFLFSLTTNYLAWLLLANISQSRKESLVNKVRCQRIPIQYAINFAVSTALWADSWDGQLHYLGTLEIGSVPYIR